MHFLINTVISSYHILSYRSNSLFSKINYNNPVDQILTYPKMRTFSPGRKWIQCRDHVTEVCWDLWTNWPRFSISILSEWEPMANEGPGQDWKWLVEKCTTQRSIKCKWNQPFGVPGREGHFRQEKGWSQRDDVDEKMFGNSCLNSTSQASLYANIWNKELLLPLYFWLLNVYYNLEFTKHLLHFGKLIQNELAVSISL